MNVYEIVTERIIKQMQQGIIPWEKPWHGDDRSGAVSYTTGKPYSLINQMLLGREGEWLTRRQILELDGSIKEGVEPGIVVFYKKLKYKLNAESEADETETEEMESTSRTRTIPLLRYYNVWHIDDVEGVESRMSAAASKAPDPDEEAERIVMGYIERNIPLRLEIKHTDRAFYSPATDTVEVPEITQYTKAPEYYSTMFHELIHSTGIKSRLDRPMEGAFGSKPYAREELVAEMGAAMLLSRIGLRERRTERNSVAYLQNWIQVLRNDDRAMVWAASRAEKAARYIMNEQEETTNQSNQ